jgi:flagellar hook-associated protein 1
MSLNSIFNIGVSGLMTAQSQLKLVSDNVSNVNTPGYIRKIGRQEAQVLSGVGSGVTTTQVSLATDYYLQAASLKANSNTSKAEIFYELYDQIQSQFGNLTDENSLFNLGDKALTNISQAAENPGSNAARQNVISGIQSFLDEGARISKDIQSVRANADSRIATTVKSINDLVTKITDLNGAISQAYVTSSDATGAQTTQARLVDELSQLIDVKIAPNATGGVTVQTGSGLVLAGDRAVNLSYDQSSLVSGATSFNPIIVTGPSGEKRDFAEHIGSGELRGLLDLRDKESVAVTEQLSEYMSVYTEKLNGAHNQASAVPAPNSLTGKTLSESLPQALSGFAGKTNIVVLNSDGSIAREVELDFSTSQISVNGAAAGTFSAANFTADLTTALGGFGTANFNNGKLSLIASTGNGIAVVDEATNASNKNGKGFSHYFGLNDLISSEKPISYATGLTASSAHGFTPNDTIRFSLTGADGSRLNTIDIAMPAGNMSNLVSALNDSTTGLGRYGTFSLSPEGALSFKGFGTPPNQLGIVSDTTKRGPNSESFSQTFGLGGVASGRADGLRLNDKILNNPSQLSMAQVDLNAVAGRPALVSGDGKGAQIMAAIGQDNARFQRAGLNEGGISSLNKYAADLAGQVGNAAAAAKSRLEGAKAISNEANTRRQSYEGVNLDEELVNLTTFQQAYSASSRLIQAAKDMYDVLLNMI